MKALPPDNKLIPAFVHHYSSEGSTSDEGTVISDQKTLIELLRKLPSLNLEDSVDPITVQMQRHEPGAAFAQNDIAILNFVDDAVSAVLAQTDLDYKIEAYVRNIAPQIAVTALENDIKSITQPSALFELIDLIIQECIGWSEDLGILGEQFIEKFDVPMRSFASGRISTEVCIKDLKKVLKKEAPIFKKLEERLCERELKVLAGMKGRYFAAELLNKQMTGKQLPLFIIFMLQGPWYEFLQQVFVNCGENSKEWANMQKVTEALIWSLQPNSNTHKQQQIMASVSDSIRTFCDTVKFDTSQVIEALADLEAEYEAIKVGEGSDPCDFELIETDESLAAAFQAVSRDVVADIKATPIGQWFLYDDPAEPDEKVARIKLILNWEETEQLLLTNHNRRKVVHMAYGEMANFLKTGVLKKLNPQYNTADSFRGHIVHVVKAVSEQNKKEKQIAEQEKRKEASVEYSNLRKEELLKQLEVLENKAKRKKQRAMVLRHKAAKKQAMAEQTVTSLKQDAWVKLPIMEGTLTPCKLVAIIPANSTYIFANRAGIKVAEYSSSQLAHMIVTENSEILDTGAEFESALATVVSGLREDKNKSYDELTGDTG